jgi:hypothetical protein
MILHLVTADPADAPARFVPEGTEWPCKVDPPETVVIPVREWEGLSKPMYLRAEPGCRMLAIGYIGTLTPAERKMPIAP